MKLIRVHTWRPGRPSRARPAPWSQPPGTSSCSLSAPSLSPAARLELLSAGQYTDGDTQMRQTEDERTSCDMFLKFQVGSES